MVDFQCARWLFFYFMSGFYFRNIDLDREDLKHGLLLIWSGWNGRYSSEGTH